MSDHHDYSNTNWIGLVLTGISFLYANITSSDLAGVFTILLAAGNMIILWPKLRDRLKEIKEKHLKRKNKLP